MNWNHIPDRPVFMRSSLPQRARFDQIAEVFNMPLVADDLLVCFHDYYMALITMRGLFLSGASIAQTPGLVGKEHLFVIEQAIAPFEFTAGEGPTDELFDLSVVGVLNTVLDAQFQVKRFDHVGGRPAPLTLMSTWSKDLVPRLLGFSLKFGDVISLLPDEENELLGMIARHGIEDPSARVGRRCTKIRFLLARLRGIEAEVRGEVSPRTEDEEEDDE